MNKFLLFFVLLSGSITLDAIDTKAAKIQLKKAAVVLKERQKAEKKAAKKLQKQKAKELKKKAQPVVTTKHSWDNLHEVNCNGQCNKCNYPELVKQSYYAYHN